AKANSRVRRTTAAASADPTQDNKRKVLSTPMPKPRIPKAARYAKGLPDRDTLLKFIRESGETDKAAIARAFGLKGSDRRALGELLRGLEDDGSLGRRGRKGFAEAGALPEVGVADVVERDPDGDLLIRLTRAEDAPLVTLAPDRRAEEGQ